MQYISYHECKQRGTFDFPIEFHHVDYNHPRYTLPYHWHVEYEIIRILQGEFFITLNENSYKAEKGDIIFINSGTLHSAVPKNCIYQCIVFDLNMLLKPNDICNKYIQPMLDGILVVNDMIPKDIPLLHEIIWDLFYAMEEKSEGYELVVRGGLYQLFGFIIKEKLFTKTSKQTAKDHTKIVRLKKVIERMEESYTTTLTLEELSKTIGMSEKHFCRFFKEMTNRSPMDYLNYLRIEHACYQLNNSDLTITEIAYSCGFNDLSYFVKTFKKYKGETPRKYRISEILAP